MPITSDGKATITALVGGFNGYVAFCALALDSSSNAFDKSQSAPVSEISTGGLSRASATVSRGTTTDSDDTLSFYKSWTCSSGPVSVNAVCVMNNATSGGTMGSRDVLPSTRTMQTGDTISEQINWIFG